MTRTSGKSFGASLLSFALALPLTVFCGSGAIACFSFASPRLAIQATYDPFNPVAVRTPFTVEIKNGAAKPCDGAIVFSGPGAAAASGSRRLTYSLLSESGANLMSSGASPPNLGGISALNLRVNPGESRTIGVYLVIPPGQVTVPGLYTDTLHAEVRSSGASRDTIASSASLFVGIAAPPILSVNVAGGGSFTTIDFGTLTRGASRSVAIQARSNQRYRLKAVSENGGVLTLDPPSPGGNPWTIPYSIRVDGGVASGLAAGKAFEIARPATGLQGREIPIEVKIGETEGRRAGRYRDLIVVSIDPAP